MWTLGIDVAKRAHCAHVLDEAGVERLSGFRFANSHAGLCALREKLAQCGAAPHTLRVGMEATGHYWMALHDQLRASGHAVAVLNPLVTHARRNMTIRGHKTDPADARIIAHVLREPGVPLSAVARDEVRQLRTLARMRFELSAQATADKLRLGALLDRAFPEYAQLMPCVTGTASLCVLSHYPTAVDMAQANLRRLSSLLQAGSAGKLGRDKAVALRDAARNSFCVTSALAALRMEITMCLQRLELYQRQCAALEDEFKNQLGPQQALLRSIPGIGPVWAATILAEVLPIFDPAHQEGGKKFVAYAGLDPKANDSGQSNGRARMSKRGSKYLRTAAMQAAEVAALRVADPMFRALYERHIAKGKHHANALSHVANKLLHVVFAVLRDNKNYEPHVPQHTERATTTNEIS